jgi:two-component system, OmpR family, response regulator
MSARARRILCVDDHADTCFMLQTLFGRAGREVASAPNVAEALRLTESQSFDLFVLDVRFPDGSGIDLCKRLRELHPHAPVVFYSGRAYEADRNEALSACAEAYVAKPSIDQLVSEVERLLAEARG